MVNTLNIEDRLEGETNFQAWKERVLLLLEENDLKEYVEGVVVAPTDVKELAAHKKREVKANQVLLESMKDNLIAHIVEKTYSRETYDALVGLYENGNICRKLHLKHQIQFLKISSEDMIVNYLMNITQIQYRLIDICSEMMENFDLVNVALRDIPRSWEAFV
jgi:hypothetical protein